MNTLKTKTTIFDKVYDYESLYDLGEDVEDSLDERFNEIVKSLPKDEYDFIRGSFHVTITWLPEESQ